MSDQTLKADNGKPKLSLVPPQIISDIAQVREEQQFREDIKLLVEKMCEHTVCADCPFSSRSCATSGIGLNDLSAWAEAERAKGGLAWIMKEKALYFIGRFMTQ